jgi:predicted DCC family thiol-disulfide oxidoreductase YuxK
MSQFKPSPGASRRPLPEGRLGFDSSLLTKVFGLDLRSLALFRIAVSLFILADLLVRSVDLTAFYTDSGAFPRSFAALYYSGSPVYEPWNPTIFSVHMLTGSTLGIAALFALNAVAAIALLFGFRTRLMTFIVWFFLASLQARNPLVLSVGDDVVRVLLFFAIFLPLGAHFSIDAALNPRKDETARTNAYLSPSTAVFYLQVIAIYFFAALLKNSPEWRTDGTALYYAFSFDQFALPLAKRLLAFPGLLKTLTFAAWWVEFAAGFALLIPADAGKILGIVLLAGLQLGIGLTLALGHNPWVNTIALIPFLPALVWDRPVRRKGVEIIYDGDCSFCRKVLMILLEILRPALAGEPAPARGKDLATLRRENSWIVRNGSDEFYRFDAVIEFLRTTPLFSWLCPLLRLKPVHSVGERAYRFVANHRGPLARIISPLKFREIGIQHRNWSELLAVFLFAGVLVYNIAWETPTQRLNSVVSFPVLAARLEQYWGMFAPSPSRDDGWYVVEGILRNGSKADVFRRTDAINEQKPASATDFYPNERWRRYMMNLGTRDLQDFRQPFTAYLCRNWNREHTGATHLERGSVFFIRETTPPPGQAAETTKLDLINYACPR